MVSKYCLLFKTAQSEFRAWENLYPNAKTKVLPIVELTRGRKIPRSEKNWRNTGKDIEEAEWSHKKGIFAFYSNLDKVINAFAKCDEVIVDLTREELLSCYEINEISKSINGYVAWTDFLSTLNKQIPNLIPTIIINPSDDETTEDYKNNVITQFDTLTSKHSSLAYRAAILVDPDFLYDLTLLKDKINSYIDNGGKFFIELDHEYIRNGMGILHALRSIKIIEDINALIPNAEIILIATSFPSTVDADNHDSFPLEENYLYEELRRITSSKIKLLYGDYGSINPVRNDIKGARGWVPRIDYPTDNKRIFYYRERRDKVGKKVHPITGKKSPIYSDYGSHYKNVAYQVIHDADFKEIPNSWGVKKIKSTATGVISGKAPSFWISVRMEIHILQQLTRLSLI